MVMQQRAEDEQVMCLGHQFLVTLGMLLFGEVLTNWEELHYGGTLTLKFGGQFAHLSCIPPNIESKIPP
jgi:hypothetical protein